MKRILFFLVMISVFSCSQAQRTQFSAEAMAENLLSEYGKQLSFETILTNHKGKTVVIEIWASWCRDCVKAMPKVKELQSNFPNADYIFISMDKTAIKWKEGIAKHKIVGDHYMANDQMKGVFANAINLDWIPRFIIIDKTGKIILYRAIETDFEKINLELSKLKN